MVNAILLHLHSHFLFNKMLDKFEDHFERMKPYPKLLEVRGKNMKLIMVV